VGAIGSGVLGALMLNLNWSLGQIFLVLAIPMLIAGLAIFVMRTWVIRYGVQPEANFTLEESQLKPSVTSV
jgi:hypothetical protein